ncbi:amino acid adenylation domain-containing protein [Fulvivirga sp. 29W222]|uniref:Amino acid adenylation domain-containing protein n=1 Tax=Fulvivirga marina TaxID=2494733 RepID=A0A937G2M2_9BACT|nr:non-ribosomal peptide synthetase [Fulvivirga marina]MBL6449338.1 amino acid adenylation domain-containing protein [Fulvivirga marina]
MNIKECIDLLDKNNFFLEANGDKLVLKARKNKVSEEQAKAIKQNTEVLKFIKENKQELIDHLNLKSEESKKDIESMYKLSPLQAGMMFHDLYDQQVGAYRNQLKCDLKRVDLNLFKQAWDHLIKSHTILRSSFHYDAFKIPVQCVHRHVEMPLEIVDLSHLNGHDLDTALDKYEREDRSKPFDFKKAPLMRVTLLKLGDDSYKMLWSTHHILLDGWSRPILMEEFLQVYDKLSASEDIKDGEVDRFEDYIRFIDSQDKEKAQAYWSEHLKPVTGSTLLPFIPVSAERTRTVSDFNEEILVFDEDVTQKVELFTKRNRITVNTLMQGVWSYLLHQYTGEETISFGVVVSGRPENLQNVERRVGMYINTLPLVSVFDKSSDVKTWLKGIQNDQIASRKFQYNALADIQKWSGVHGDLFDSIMVFQNFPLSELTSSTQWKLEVSNFKGLEQSSNYPLLIRFSVSRQINVEIIYKEELLPKEFINLIKLHLEQVLLSIVEEGDTSLNNLHLLEAHPIAEKSGEAQPQPDLVALFEAAALNFPDKVALEYLETKLTYKELNEYANRLANHLIGKGVEKGTLVPIHFDKSPQMIIAILSVMKAGGAYVPLGHKDPEERLRKIVGMANMTIGLCEVEPSVETVEWISIGQLNDIFPNESVSNPDVQIAGQDLAYVIFTSGSTGEPKGVMVEHSGISNYIHNQTDLFKIDDSERILQFSDYTFDASIEQIFLALTMGATLVLIPGAYRLDKELFEQFLKQKQLTHLHATPSFLKVLTPGKYGGLRRVVCGGEICDKQLAEEWVNYCQFYNKYGPAEATITVCEYQCSANDLQKGVNSVPIGKPVANTNLYVLNELGQQVPTGVLGELHIGGVQVARGYLNNEDLTASHFVQNPYNSAEKLYKTGDLVRFLPDGNLEFVGRHDEQLKVRGYRIEIAEIERALLDAPGVLEGVVLVVEEASNTQLAAYVVMERVFDPAAIKEALKSELPEYMIPGIIVELESIPLLPSGKVDKKQLKELGIADIREVEYEAPVGAMEEALATVWQELLSVDQVGRQHNYFELGGDSIISIQVVSRIRKLGFELQVGDLFTYQTIARISQAVSKRIEDEKIIRKEAGEVDTMPLTLSQKRLINNTSFACYPDFTLALNKMISREQASQCLNQMIARYQGLQATFIRQNGQWRQKLISKQLELSAVTVPSDISDLSAFLESERKKLYNLIDLDNNELISSTWLETPEEEQHNRLILVVHHLLMNTVNWRDFINDLNRVFAGQELSEPKSYKEILTGIEEQTQKPLFGKWVEQWESQIQGKEAGQAKSEKTYQVYKQSIADENLSTSLNLYREVYHANDTEILLSAIYGTLGQWKGDEQLVIGVESDSGATGQLHSAYPFMLKTTANDAGHALKLVKSFNRQNPEMALTYSAYADKKGSGNNPWDIRFKFYGAYQQEEGPVSLASERACFDAAPGSYGHEQLIIACRIEGEKLQLELLYDPAKYGEVDMASLTDKLTASIEHFLSNAAALKGVDPQFSPADFGLSKEVSIDDFDEFLDGHLDNGATRRSSIQSCYRLSALQSGMLFHSLYDENAATYRNQLKCDIVNLDEQAHKQTWEYLLQKHTIFRSTFHHDVFSIPVQCVHKTASLPIEVIDLTSLEQDELIGRVEKIEEADLQQGFRFDKAPLMRVTLIRLNETHTRMLWTSHHLLHDGWSLPILMEEFLTYYDISVNGVNHQIKEEDKYEDYIRFIESQDNSGAAEYWQSYLEEIEVGTLLPFIESSSLRNKGAGTYKEINLNIDKQTTEAIRSFARRHRLTVNTLMQGTWAYLLHQFTGQRDVTFGVVVSGRPEDIPSVEKRVGMYINTLPLRSSLQKSDEILPWLTGIQNDQVNSRNYQYQSLNEIQGLVGVQGDLFDSIMAFQNFPLSKVLDAQDWKLKVEEVYVQEQSNYPLYITIGAFEEINAHFFYNTNLLDPATVKLITEKFHQVLTQIINRDSSKINELKLLTPAERNQLLFDFNQTSADYPLDKTIPDFFREQARLHPQEQAVVYKGHTMTYAELDKKSDELAHNLLSYLGGAENSPVPVLMDRSSDLVISVLAIMKAGLVYVPIDPEQPEERIAYILEDLSAKAIIADPAYDHLIKRTDLRVIHLAESEIKDHSGELPGAQSDQLAYIIYTSGSTGKPKGVMVEHRNLANYVLNSKELYMTDDATSGSYSFMSSVFDASLTAVFTPLVSGKSIIISPKEAEVFDREITRQNDPFGFIKLTPAHLLLLEQDPSVFAGTRNYVVGGEQLTNRHLKVLNVVGQDIRVYNEYGPTEATVGCAVFSLQNESFDDYTNIPIGKPMANVQLYVLNESMEPVMKGAVGELYIGGVQVARGYWNNDVLTQERFVDNPFAEGQLFKSGDLVKMRGDGNLEFLGRKDHQVKVRGYRVELGEVEKVINSAEGVNQAVVLTSINKSTDSTYLSGYVVTQGQYSREKLMTYLKDNLPAYMIPDRIIEVEEIPLTINGKVDRKTLLELEKHSISTDDYQAAENELQQELMDIWKEFLELETVGVNDEFFSIGGNSLLAISIISVIRKRLKIDVSVTAFFELTTVAKLSQFIELNRQNELVDQEEYETIKL